MINILLYFIGIIFMICFYIVICLALGFVVFVLPIIILGKVTNTKAVFSVVAKKDVNYNPVIIEKIKNARNVKYDICSLKKTIIEKPINNIFKKNIFHINENIKKISKININDFVKNKDLKDI